MPTRELFRAWCSKCQEWELHTQHYRIGMTGFARNVRINGNPLN
jgi:hypothetical protein